MKAEVLDQLEAYPIPDPYAPAAGAFFKRGDFVVHRWDVPKPSEVLEVVDVREDEICIRFLDGSLIAGEVSAWMPSVMFQYAPTDWAPAVFVGAV
jgi:hypothetical protein